MKAAAIELDRPILPHKDQFYGGLTKIAWERLRALLGMCERALAQWDEPASPVRLMAAELARQSPPAPTPYRPLQRVAMHVDVLRLLFEEYEEHRRTERGAEETGWILLGRRDVDQATVMGTLPAGANRNAGEAHVQFDSTVQVVASRIVRQKDRRLVLLGIVHTHPGSLRHPSDGDYRGDIEWISQLRGEEGIFGIGTADGKFADGTAAIGQPRPNLQALHQLSFAWYSLKRGDRNYVPIPIEVIAGPDLAAPLRSVWKAIESHAPRLERLAKQQAKVQFDIVDGALLEVIVPLAESSNAVRVLLSEKEVKYYLVRDGVLAADLYEPCVDRGVYRLLAELAGD